MKEEGWKLGEVLLGWGHHLGHRVWARARVGTWAEQGMDTALVNTKGPWHTHMFAQKDLKFIQTHSRPLPPPPTKPCRLKSSLKGTAGPRGYTFSFAGSLSPAGPVGSAGG